MSATIAPIHPVANRRTRRKAAAPQAPVAAAPVEARSLPMRVSAGVRGPQRLGGLGAGAARVSAPNWMWILGGAVAGGLLLGPIGALAGGLAGAFLVR